MQTFEIITGITGIVLFCNVAYSISLMLRQEKSEYAIEKIESVLNLEETWRGATPLERKINELDRSLAILEYKFNKLPSSKAEVIGQKMEEVKTLIKELDEQV